MQTYGDGNYPFLEEKFVKNANVSGKKVLVRCDFNVPFYENGDISDTKRIDETVETILFLVSNNAAVILCSHLGRPHGEKKASLTLKPVAIYLEKKLGMKVKFIQDVIGLEASNCIKSIKPGEIFLLENLRYEIEEENCDQEFAKKLSEGIDIYVNDAFGTCHREHASLVLLPELLSSYYGFLVKKEFEKMLGYLENPQRPFISILGGAKVSDKIEVIKSFLNKVDGLIIGGGMTYTFINALGYSVGDSICEKDKLNLAKNILSEAKEKNVKILLPIDTKVGKEYSPQTESKLVDADKIPDGWQGLDIGPKTIELFSSEIKNAQTIIWNGPLGVSEWKQFEDGTFSIAKIIAQTNATTVIGGGDSAVAIKKLGLSEKMSHISTGGGASLMFFEGKELPGIKAVMNSSK